MKVDRYLKILSKYISDAEIREEVIQEYKNHIDDNIAFLMEHGMTLEEAEKETVKQMGDPKKAGREMGKIYRQVWDIKMLIYFLVLGILGILLYCIYGWLQNDNIYENPSMPILFTDIVGVVLIVFGFTWSFVEKWKGYPLFYAWARDWNGGGITNSALILVLGIFFLGYSRGVITLIAMTILFSVLQFLQRATIEYQRQKKESKLLWKTGVAQTDVLPYKGMGIIEGKKYRLNAKPGSYIEKNTPFVVVDFEGMKPMVEIVDLECDHQRREQASCNITSETGAAKEVTLWSFIKPLGMIFCGCAAFWAIVCLCYLLLQ